MSVTPTQAERDAAAQWLAAAFSTLAGPGFPLSFRYGQRTSAELLPSWRAEWSRGADLAGATRSVLTLTDPETGLECRCEITAYDDYPAVEWVAYLRNTGLADTPVIADIQALDTAFALARHEVCKVHHAKGSECQYDDFEPLATAIGPGRSLHIASVGGRSSDGALPFFNVEMAGRGVIGAVGWTGGWAVQFERDREVVRVRAGMQRTHLKLLPGEEIRTPRILLLFWTGEHPDGLVRSHNLWRRLILAHHTPRPNGRLLSVPVSDTSWGERMVQTQLAKVRWHQEQQLGVDTFWIDAGWHGDNPFDPKADTFGTAWVIQVGNWWPNKITYPQGLGPIGAACRAANMGFVLWFEPERVYQGTQFTKECPEWLLGPIGPNYLFNLGVPAARQALTDKISAVIAEGGITVYRQDFNFQPAPYWQAADAPDRVGMTEIRHIEGLYAFWDELLARHPGLIIDNCSSGGRRIDLETISRSVPLWRSDVQCWADFDAVAMHTQSHGLAPWAPLSAGCARTTDPYAFRSALGPGIIVDWATPVIENGAELDLAAVRQRMREVLVTRPYFYGDFYPLCSYSPSADAWSAWQFDRPDLGEGMVLALRRPRSPFPVLQTVLHGLTPGAQYEWRNLDTDEVVHISGQELLDAGVSLEINEKPGSALFTYKTMRDHEPFVAQR